MSLPLIKSDDQVMQLMQTKWKSQLDPVLANPLTDAQILTGVKLINGVTQVNHLLGRQMQGWIIADIDASANIFRSQPMNMLTLTLTSNAACTVTLVVY